MSTKVRAPRPARDGRKTVLMAVTRQFSNPTPIPNPMNNLLSLLPGSRLIVRKTGIPDSPDCLTPKWEDYTPGVINPDPVSLPMGYEVEGFLGLPLKVGDPLFLHRIRRNDVMTPGYFKTSVVTAIDDMRVSTANSSYVIEVVALDNSGTLGRRWLNNKDNDIDCLKNEKEDKAKAKASNDGTGDQNPENSSGTAGETPAAPAQVQGHDSDAPAQDPGVQKPTTVGLAHNPRERSVLRARRDRHTRVI